MVLKVGDGLEVLPRELRPELRMPLALSIVICTNEPPEQSWAFKLEKVKVCKIN